MKDAYVELEKSRGVTVNVQQKTELFEGIWSFLAPFKAKITTWRLILDRLPTKENLIKRNVISLQSARCSCCDERESSSHLFVTCPDIVKLFVRHLPGHCEAMEQHGGVDWG